MLSKNRTSILTFKRLNSKISRKMVKKEIASQVSKVASSADKKATPVITSQLFEPIGNTFFNSCTATINSLSVKDTIKVTISLEPISKTKTTKESMIIDCKNDIPSSTDLLLKPISKFQDIPVPSNSLISKNNNKLGILDPYYTYYRAFNNNFKVELKKLGLNPSIGALNSIIWDCWKNLSDFERSIFSSLTQTAKKDKTK